MTRTRRLFWSENVTAPVASSMAAPHGLETRAAGPEPSENAAAPLPTAVYIVVRAALRRRTRWPAKSETMTAPFEWVVTVTAPVKDAAVAAPSAEPDAPLPARSVATPAGETARSLRFAQSPLEGGGKGGEGG